MAETQPMNVNGNYLPRQPEPFVPQDHNFAAHNANSSVSTNPEFSGPQSGANAGTGNGGNSAAIPKPEVGWYFVEQYYTTMSRNPEKLFLFYNRRSQFVSGNEAETVAVCVGQKSINDRIKELDIQDCKVRVTNVDSQGSGQNIVIQVIGEISMKSATQRKFTQTFVLAEQTNGYFVLNDIFRYITEDDEEPEGDDVPQQAPVAVEGGHQESADPVDVLEPPHGLTNSNDPIEQEQDAAIVDESIGLATKEEPIVIEPAVEDVNGGDDFVTVEETPAVEAAADDVPSAELEEEVKVEELAQLDAPQEPEPSPIPSPAKSTPPPTAAPAAPAKPAAPKTWANLVAGNKPVAVAPAVPAGAPTGPSASSRATPPVSTQPLAPSPAPITTSSTPEPDQTTTPQSSGSEWQTAGAEHSRKQSRPQTNQAPVDNHRAYIKNVGDNIDAGTLRGTLAKYGEVVYLDINRQKNCAFVDFGTPAAYQAAVAANPHEVNGDRIYVEERRFKPAGAGFSAGRGGVGRGGTRGTESPRGRGNFNKDNRGRASFPTGRGGAPNSRGRGASTTV